MSLLRKTDSTWFYSSQFGQFVLKNGRRKDFPSPFFQQKKPIVEFSTTDFSTRSLLSHAFHQRKCRRNYGVKYSDGQEARGGGGGGG